MADTGRAKSEEDAGDGGRRREELDALLQRIAAHVAEVEKRQSAGPSDASATEATPTAASDQQAPSVSPSSLPLKGGISEQDLKAARRALRRARLQAELGSATDPSSTSPSATHTSSVAPVEPNSPVPPSSLGLAPTDSDRAPSEPPGRAPIVPLASDVQDAAGTDAPSVAPPLRRPLGAVEPPALRSALGAAHQVEMPRKRSTLDEDLDDAIDTSSGMPERAPRAISEPEAVGRNAQPSDSPWDHEQAEALTRTYETEAAEPPLRSMLDIMGQQIGAAPSAARSPARTSAASAPAMAAATSAATLVAPHPDVMSAVRRVEAALELLAPRDAIEALDHRFTMLEGEIQRTSAELHRLDGIEDRLGELAGKLSDEQVVALFGNLVPTAEDLTQFAEDAAGRAAERVLEAHMSERALLEPAQAESATSGSGLRQLTEQLSAFMDERRRSEAGTIDALETLQLAMQHLLDRLDRVEERAEPASQDAGFVPSPVRQPAVMSAPERHPEPHKEPYHEPRFEPQAQPAARSVPVDLDTMPDAPGYDEARPPRAESHPAGAQRGDDIAATFTMRDRLDHKLPGDDAEAASGMSAQPAAPPVSDRQAFIAMARKAAERAKAEAMAQAASEKGQRGTKARGAATPASPGEPKPEASGALASALSGLAGGVRPAVLVVALVATLLLLGYMFIAGPKFGMNFGFGRSAVSQSAPEETEEQSAPTPADKDGTKSGAQPDLEKESRADDAPAAQKLASGATEQQATEPMREASYRLPPAATSALGIAVQESTTPASPEQVMQSRERARLAALSHRTSVTASTNHPAPPGTTLIETASVPATGGPQAVASSKTTQLELPPATAGPLSLRLAAAKGEASAQLEIATRLAEGKGVKQNLAEAVTWYRRAAEQGEAVAQYRLATLYERGIGVSPDQAAAAKWYRRAAESGNLKAQHNLAVLSASPRQGSPDYATAAQLFTKAADSGLADSQYNLGILYESGLGVPKDHAVALKWYTLAAKSGDLEAARRRDQLIARLPAETIQAGERLVGEYRPQSSSARANDARFAGEGWKQSRAGGR